MDEYSGEVDLFGEPVIIRDTKAGRPEHVRTVENANKVSLLFACDYSVKDVAAALGITQPTLRKHYFHEITQRRHAKLKLTGLQLARLNSEAAKGNVAAEKALSVLVEREQTRNLSEHVLGRGKMKRNEPKAKPLGKKEERQAAARDVAGRFGTREPPPQLIN